MTAKNSELVIKIKELNETNKNAINSHFGNSKFDLEMGYLKQQIENLVKDRQEII